MDMEHEPGRPGIYKILFLVPPVLLAAITLVWLFYEDGRWYSYKLEWQWMPLFLIHLLLPVFYLVALIVRIIRHVNKEKRSSSDVFYIASSIVLSVVCFIGLFVFLIFTSGA